MSWEKVVGQNIRKFRKVRGLTQQALALEADLDVRYLGGIERGEQNPTVAILGRIAEVLKARPSSLFDDSKTGDS